MHELQSFLNWLFEWFHNTFDKKIDWLSDWLTDGRWIQLIASSQFVRAYKVKIYKTVFFKDDSWVLLSVAEDEPWQHHYILEWN